jgi:hypothetical protein
LVSTETGHRRILVGWGKVLSQTAQILSARDYDEIHKI